MYCDYEDPQNTSALGEVFLSLVSVMYFAERERVFVTKYIDFFTAINNILDIHLVSYVHSFQKLAEM